MKELTCVIVKLSMVSDTHRDVFEVNNQHGGRKDNTIILTNGQLTISTTSGEAHV
jgi:hypothetical protein